MSTVKVTALKHEDASVDNLTLNSDGTSTLAGNLVFSDASVQTTAPIGKVVQVVNFQTGAMATGTTLIPYDDTIPQITEGTEFMTLSITPTSATNKLRLDIVTYHFVSAEGRPIAALFVGTTADALACGGGWYQPAAHGHFTSFSHFIDAGVTSSLTFRVRIGNDNAGTLTFNGGSGVRKYGGILSSSITITEIAV